MRLFGICIQRNLVSPGAPGEEMKTRPWDSLKYLLPEAIGVGGIAQVK